MTIETLITAASRHGLDPAALDEDVLEASHASAAHAYNNDPSLAQLPPDEAHELVHSNADTVASDVNGGGLESQLRFLTSRWGLKAVADRLSELGVPILASNGHECGADG